MNYFCLCNLVDFCSGYVVGQYLSLEETKLASYLDGMKDNY